MINEPKLNMLMISENEKYFNKVKHLSYYRKGVLISEGFFIWSLCKYYNIDVLIESGIANGRSTILFVNSMAAPEIHSVDVKLSESIKTFANVKSDIELNLYEDDSCAIIPWLINKMADKRIGIFIDGPKGVKACEMASAYYKFEQVKFITIHDQCKWHNNHLMDKYFHNVIYSDSNWFRTIFGHQMDENDFKYLSFLDNIKSIRNTGFVVGAVGK